MSPRHWRDRVNDIIGAIEEIQRMTAGMDAAKLKADLIRYQAVLYNFVIIGEAARAVPADVCKRYPGVAWREMRQMRNVVTHVYFGVDAQRVIETIVKDLPVALAALQRLLAEEGGT